jgi:hypothetical protein
MHMETIQIRITKNRQAATLPFEVEVKQRGQGYAIIAFAADLGGAIAKVAPTVNEYLDVQVAPEAVVE